MTVWFRPAIDMTAAGDEPGCFLTLGMYDFTVIFQQNNISLYRYQDCIGYAIEIYPIKSRPDLTSMITEDFKVPKT